MKKNERNCAFKMTEAGVEKLTFLRQERKGLAEGKAALGMLLFSRYRAIAAMVLCDLGTLPKVGVIPKKRFAKFQRNLANLQGDISSKFNVSSATNP